MHNSSDKYQRLANSHLQDHKIIREQFYKITHALTFDLYRETAAHIIPYLQLINFRLIQMMNDAGVLPQFSLYIKSTIAKTVILGSVLPPDQDSDIAGFVEKCLVNVRVNVTFIYNVFKYLQERAPQLKIATEVFDKQSRQRELIDIKTYTTRFCIKNTPLPADTLQESIGQNCMDALPIFEQYTKEERQAYRGVTSRLTLATTKYVQSNRLEKVSALSQYVAGVSGHLLDLYTFTAVFVLDLNELWYAVLAVAMLIDSIQFYNHAIREILVVFAVFSTNEQLKQSVASLFDDLDPLTFRTRASSVYTLLQQHVMSLVGQAKSEYKPTFKSAETFIKVFTQPEALQDVYALMQSLGNIHDRLLKLSAIA